MCYEDIHPFYDKLALGHYRYYGVSDNYERINEYLYRVENMFFKWINRRSQKQSMTWDDFKRYLRRFPLPKPRIYVSFFGSRNGYFCESLFAQPCAGNLHARLYRGATVQ